MSAKPVIGRRYRLLRLIGTGGMASVYRAHDDRCSRDVAVKLIGEHLATDELAVRRFKRESALCARLDHPNVVAGLDGGYDEPRARHFIVMELVDGEDAARLLKRRRRLPAAEAVDIVEQVCDALTYTHHQGIVHGDVSLANVLVRLADGSVKLTDFGIARTGWTARAGAVSQSAGTPGYLAPEVAEGGEATPRSDLYSLGAAAHRLIAGDSRWRRDPDCATVALDAAAHHRPPLDEMRPDVPAAVGRAIEKALARDPRERQHSVAEFRRELVGSAERPAA
jgi:serine/threonine protein kinase